ncbi:retrovirus-related pol polyprotein from transposon TNT 1-94 [Tanacetum coccineum]
MNKEIQALENNKTWDLTSLPANKSPIGCKWVFRIKYFIDGTIDKFKARLMAKGFTQSEGIDYKETFAPVAKMVTIRALLALAVQRNWFIQQQDVNNAFLHGDLNEELYMTLFQDYNTTLPPGTICKLKKSLYGLNYADTSLFTLTQGENTVILLIYVDDTLLVRNCQILLTEIKGKLNKEFSIKDLGHLNYYLGIEFLKNSSCLNMSQRKYALDLLQQANVLNDKPSITPLDPVKSLNDTDGDPLPE